MNIMCKFKSSIFAFSIYSCSLFSFAGDLSEISQSFIKTTMAECGEFGPILAEAKWNTWQKSSNFSSEKYGKDTYALVVKAHVQQCFSVKVVLTLRRMKSMLSSKEAMDLGLDEQIKKQMLIIERTL